MKYGLIRNGVTVAICSAPLEGYEPISDGIKLGMSPTATDAELAAAQVTQARLTLRSKVATDYDNHVIAGFAVTPSWSAEPLIILERDVELLSGVLATAGALLSLGQITPTSPVLTSYTFGDGTVKTAIQFAQLVELNLVYQQTRSVRYLAHKAVKDALDAGTMPAQADYEACGLTLESFEGLELT